MKGRYVLLRHQRCSKKSRKPKVIAHDARERYLGEPNLRAIKKEVAGKTFEPAEIDSAHLEKMTKRKDGQKLNQKGVRGFEEREIKNKRTPEWKVSYGLSKKQHQKKEIMRNREMLNLLGDGHKTGSDTQGAKEGNQ